MGIVVNQTIKNIIITCLGFGIGAMNTLFLFTNFMDKEYYGLITYLMTASNLVWPLMAFGMHNTLVKFFSSYKSREQQERFLTMMLVFPVVVSLVLGGVGVALYNLILEMFSVRNTIVKPYIWTIFIMAYTLSYFEIFFAWSKVKLKSVLGNLMKELFLRICISVLLLLFYFSLLTIHQFVFSLVGAYVIRVLLIGIYALKLHPIKLRFSLPDNYINVLKYSVLILIAGSVATILIDLDKAMIERYLPIENVAKYSICAYIASVIIIPSRAMHQITYPLTAKLLNEGAKEQLKELYKKSSINLLIISGLLMVLIVCNVHQLFTIIPDEYELYIWVVVLIGTAKLFDNMLGNNNSILYNSNHYRVVLYVGLIMVVLSILFNMICIPIYGITGAAVATGIAVFCYNCIKLWIVYSKFGLFPFSHQTIVTLLIIIGFVFGCYFWEFSFHPFVNIALKSIFIGFLYIVVIYMSSVSNDINALIKKTLKGA
ncbi:polysaccharide biosynthesis C-terminal domain-containing protein [Aquimarina sp. 2201CG1-2-11]|uniref:oligosaccharide flippase family protein n=1 Tax=Aquimarina discodermiae TaxID=3231043 RepID=UPI0034624550